MTTTVTPNLGLTVPGVGTETFTNAAGEINGDLAVLDTMYGGANILSVAGGANVTLTGPQAQNLIQQFTGVLTGNITVFLPAHGAFYAIENATTGAFALAVGCTGGNNTITVPEGLSIWIWTDGTTTRLSNPPGWTEISNTTLSSAASVALALPAPFRRFRLTLHGIQVSSAGATLGMVTSNNGGASYVVTGYSGLTTRSLADSTITVFPVNNAASCPLTNSLAASTTVPWDGTYEIFPGGGTLGGTLRGNGFGVNITPNFVSDDFAFLLPTIGINAIQVAASTGGFSGVVIIEGLP